MLDIRWIRENPEALDRGLRNRGAEPAAERLIALDEQRRADIAFVQAAQENRNRLSREIGAAKAAKDEARVSELLTEVSRLKSDIIKAGEQTVGSADERLKSALAELPNIPLDDVPVGADEHANFEIRKSGKPKWHPDDAEPRPNWIKEHFELGEALGQMDFEIAAKLSGSRFVVLKAGLARMERALGQFMLDLHTQEHGYTEVQPPLLVNENAMLGTGQLPKFGEDLFWASSGLTAEIDELGTLLSKLFEEWSRARLGIAQLDRLPILERRIERLQEEYQAMSRRAEGVPSRRLGLIPTAEVPLTNLVREQILAEEALPLRYTALTPCFRSEAGSAGKDTRGMLRQHQFDKVELVSITTPEQSREEHERMTECAETVLKRLGLAYRVMLLSTGDMGFAAQKTYDLEVWLPGQRAFREISSCSVCGDFQARRMAARYRSKNEKQPRFVHTLNGSGVAVGRALIAVMETYQEAGGSITVPDALRPYMGGLEKIAG